MKKCGEKTEIYSRVCGYFRPVSNWNHGKREEFKERKPFQIAKSVVSVVSVLSVLLLASACATETIAKGITTKNLSGNGTVVDTHIGINADNKIPEIRTMFVSGDFASVKSGTNHVSYREESSASVWNASSVTKKRFLSITLTNAGDVPMAIRAVAEVFKEAESSPKSEEKTDN